MLNYLCYTEIAELFMVWLKTIFKAYYAHKIIVGESWWVETFFLDNYWTSAKLCVWFLSRKGKYYWRYSGIYPIWFTSRSQRFCCRNLCKTIVDIVTYWRKNFWWWLNHNKNGRLEMSRENGESHLRMIRRKLFAENVFFANKSFGDDKKLYSEIILRQFWRAKGIWKPEDCFNAEKYKRVGCALAKTDFCYETNKSGSYRVEFLLYLKKNER